jgi:hypothetical protein
LPIKFKISSFKKEFNPALEASTQKILENLSTNLSNKSSDLSSIERKSKSMKLRNESKLAGVKFFWEFELIKLDSLAIKEHIILPLMFCCAEFQFREFELFKIITAKDKEIDDYKSQGVKLSRSIKSII